METQGKGERKMTYEQAEKRIEELNEEITKIYNKIVEMTWVNKDFSNPKVKALEEKAIDLQGKRWELKEMLEA